MVGLVGSLCLCHPCDWTHSHSYLLLIHFTMDCCGHIGTFFVIIIFSLDIFTDVSTGVELLLNDHAYCKYRVFNIYVGQKVNVHR